MKGKMPMKKKDIPMEKKDMPMKGSHHMPDGTSMPGKSHSMYEQMEKGHKGPMKKGKK